MGDCGLKMGAASIFVIVEMFLPWVVYNILVPPICKSRCLNVSQSQRRSDHNSNNKLPPTPMSKATAAVRSRAKARRAASKARKSNKPDANKDMACCHCGIHMNRRGLSTREKYCNENPTNLKPPTKRDKQTNYVKKIK